MISNILGPWVAHMRKSVHKVRGKYHIAHQTVLIMFWGCFHSFTTHNSVTFLDIIIKFNRSMYQLKMICDVQASLFPLLLIFKLCPLDFFLQKFLYFHNLVTVWNILMKSFSFICMLILVCMLIL